MGTIRNGGNGAFSGKAGSFIGSTWKNISYMKGIPKLVKRPGSLKQMDQRKRFAVVTQFLTPIKDILRFGFKGQMANKASAYNVAIQHALNNAIIGSYPDYEIDPSQVLVSKGSLEFPSDLTLDVSTAGQINLTWLSKVNKYTAFGDDMLHFLMYNRDRKLFMVYDPVGVRSDVAAQIIIPSNFSGQVVDAYAFFQDRNELRCSNSIYVGEFTLS